MGQIQIDTGSGHTVFDDVAEQVVQRCISRGYGLARAKQALYEKKVPKQYWDAALADYPDQMEEITDFLRTRLGEEYDQRELKRAIDALMRRGHSYGVVRTALNNLKLDPEDFLEEE
jgi:SOS response regulatory protein OraA/RecX